MRLIKTPAILPILLPWAEWKKPGLKKTIYLTFDDGPVPEATPFVIAELEKWNAKATFFCVGENAFKNPNLIQCLLDQGHRLGNHTYNHLNGWKTSNKEYLANVQKCAETISSDLFRPPYGKINPLAIVELKKLYRIIFWDVVSYDFDRFLLPEECIRLTHKATRAGSIVVFHDSMKAMPLLKIILPRLLEVWVAEGYSFELL